MNIAILGGRMIQPLLRNTQMTAQSPKQHFRLALPSLRTVNQSPCDVLTKQTSINHETWGTLEVNDGTQNANDYNMPNMLYHLIIEKNLLQTHCLGSHVGFRIASWIFMVFACCDLTIRARASSPISNGADSTAWFDCPWRRTLSSVQCLNGSRNLNQWMDWMDTLMGNSWDSIILKLWARQKISEDVQNVRSRRE